MCNRIHLYDLILQMESGEEDDIHHVGRHEVLVSSG